VSAATDGWEEKTLSEFGLIVVWKKKKNMFEAADKAEADPAKRAKREMSLIGHERGHLSRVCL